MKLSEVNEKQRARAVTFTALHYQGTPLVLPNAWDAASARLFELSGAQAIGTSSAGIAFSRGYPDGERIPLTEMRDVVLRIKNTIDVPLTVDIEAGFGKGREEVLNTVHTMLEIGVVGVNLEDAPTGGSGSLRTIDEQCRLISSIRELASQAEIDLYLNARTDVFWLELGAPETRLQATLERLQAYRDAGASGVFVPGVSDEETIAVLVSEVESRLNVLAAPGCPDVAGMGKLGVARVSTGSAPSRAIMGLTQRIGNELLTHGRFESLFIDAISYADGNKFFR